MREEQQKPREQIPNIFYQDAERTTLDQGKRAGKIALLFNEDEISWQLKDCMRLLFFYAIASPSFMRPSTIYGPEISLQGDNNDLEANKL